MRDQTQHTPRRLAKERPARSPLRLILILLGLLAVCGAACLALAWRLGVFEPEPVTFLYGDRVMTALEGVAVNAYDPAGFSVDGQGRVTYQREGLQARMGIDVSYYQGEIDWQAVAGDGVEFAMLRLGYRGYTEGGLFLDKRFEENLRGALEAGIEVGVYFFSQALTPQEAEEEAEFVLRQLEGLPPGSITYPVAFDWEFITPGQPARTHQMDGQTLTQCALAFCQAIDQGGYTPAVYFNRDMGYLHYDLSRFQQLPLWLAEYDTSPDFFYRFHLWQYTHTGTVAGIQGTGDLNLDLRPALEEDVPDNG